MSNDDRALASIINAARDASRRERSQGLMEATRRQFRPERTQSRTPGRNRKSTWKKPMFLLRRSNSDFYPGPNECTFLEEHGIGKSTGIIERHWSINRLHRYICQLYSLVPLADTGFRFFKCGRNKKLVMLPAVNTIAELETEVGRSILVIAPNRDLNLPDVSTVNDSGTHTSTRTRTGPSRTRLQVNSSSESDNDNTPTVTDTNNRYSTQTTRSSNNNHPNTLVPTSMPPNQIQSDDSDFELQRPRDFNRATDQGPVSVNIPSRFEVDLSNSGDEDTWDEATLINFPNIVEDPVEIITLEVNRETIMAQMLELYKNETLHQKSLKVVFKDEIGLDYGGLTKELFTVFWKQCQIEYFRGENIGVPFLTLSKIRKGRAEDFIIIGRILAHTVILTKSLPPYLAKTFYLMIGNLD
ncbi:hypothetical protein FQR65_LT16861 [Abscondita terminalis]|nr:hypothetical protein FQR65_LT16861 [Abscondita terminalis]